MNVTINGEPRNVSTGLTVAELLQQLELNAKQVAVEVNLELIPRESHTSHRLGAGDTIEVMTLVGGG